MANYITIEGMKRLHKKANDLVLERPEIIKQVVAARELGDLSENAEYHAAREKQRNLEDELEKLQFRMSQLKVIDPNTLPKDAVRFGAYVELTELPENEKYIYQLVGVDEIYDRDDNVLQVSVASPLGMALIGKKPNEEFIVKAPKGVRKFIIQKIY
ncbi:MAG: transcription elongation factor GreA [Candidatus Cloacimonadales bacterium]|jgi:transcription elongation factor GreA|nr:transcription elongation factor GreA [Candidatus Cloacimonadota bacterium]MDD2650477.1 transcription elongation factor GreA [Candidatus Cloacimonadota bacterium]MDD3501380.1 transcription elongation factor GreA [Candidatus Cloacimonadota bacterium]MDX9976858.1 transcription elongation factor GreA [Candidatus Cloacimonadales bacterium]